MGRKFLALLKAGRMVIMKFTTCLWMVSFAKCMEKFLRGFLSVSLNPISSLNPARS